MTTNGATSPWLPFGAGTAGRVRLLCLPHAGAGALTYRSWGRGLDPDIDLCPIQPPGRENRIQEKPSRQVQPLVTDLARELTGLVEPPYAVFGHSMGAVLAFELVREIRRLGGPPPVHLFVAGRRAPQLVQARLELRGLPLDELARALGALGGTPPEVLADPDFLGSIAPLLRADFAVNETYRYTEQPPLDVPITAFAATTDPMADRAELAAWSAQTSREFRLHLLPGGHFAVLTQARFVHARLAEALASVPAAQRIAFDSTSTAARS